MESQHITYFKIENFKRFDSFEMNNLGQFNLIVGDNNVGKTSVLEALTFSPELIELSHNYLLIVVARRMYNYSDIVSIKQDIRGTEFWASLFKYKNKSIYLNINNYDKYSISLLSQNQLSGIEKERIKDNFLAHNPNEWIKLSHKNSNSNSFDIAGAYFESFDLDIEHYIPFIDASANYSSSLVDYFYEHFNADKESRKELENNLRSFIGNIEEIRTHKFHNNQEILCLTIIDQNGIYPITQYGDGTVKIMRILMEIYIARNKRLMIDEIGSGIHFSRLKGYWSTIFQLCSKYNVQLFATTHSLECQRAFIEALEGPEMQQYQKDARNISLIENKQGDVKAITYDFEQFEYALNIGFNTRGGSL